MVRRLRHNQDGVVFVTVLMVIIVMMVLATSITSMNVSQVKTAESEVQRIQAELLAAGTLALTYTDQQAPTPTGVFTYQESLDGITYTMTSTMNTSNSGVFQTDDLNISITY